MRTLIAVSALIISFLLSGCSSVKELDQSKTLESNTWLLRSMNGGTVTLSSGKDITLEFEKNSQGISGFGACNRYFGKYSVENDGLVFSGIGSTEMACDNMNTETDYYRLLQKTDKYKIVSNTLSLYGSGKVTLTFEKK